MDNIINEIILFSSKTRVAGLYKDSANEPATSVIAGYLHSFRVFTINLYNNFPYKKSKKKIMRPGNTYIKVLIAHCRQDK